MYFIQNIKKKKLSKFVSSIVCGDCAYIVPQEQNIINRAIKTQKTTDISFADINKDNFFQLESLGMSSLNRQAMSIKGGEKVDLFTNVWTGQSVIRNLQNSNCYILNANHLIEFPYSQEFLVHKEKVKLIGYFNKNTYSNWIKSHEFIKIVDPSVFNEKKIFKSPLEIKLTNEMFQNNPYELEHGNIDFIAGTCILYRPTGLNVAITIGGLQHNDETGKKEYIIETKLPENLTVSMENCFSQDNEQKKESYKSASKSNVQVVHTLSELNTEQEPQISTIEKDTTKHKGEEPTTYKPEFPVKLIILGMVIILALCLLVTKSYNTTREQPHSINNKISLPQE